MPAFAGMTGGEREVCVERLGGFELGSGLPRRLAPPRNDGVGRTVASGTGEV